MVPTSLPHGVTPHKYMEKENMKKQEVILREMIRDESEAVAHYTKAAMKVEDERLKKLLLDIRDEEKVHIGELKQALAEVLGINDEAKEHEGREEAKEVLRPMEVAHNAFNQVDNIHHQLFR